MRSKGSVNHIDSLVRVLMYNYAKARAGLRANSLARRTTEEIVEKVEALPPKRQAGKKAIGVVYSISCIALFIRGTRNSWHLPGRLGPCNVRTWDMRTMAGSAPGKLSP